MTQSQKEIIKYLLKEGQIVNSGVSGIRLRDKGGNPIIKINTRTFMKLRDILRKNKSVWILNKRAVTRLHGKSWIKKEYKKQLQSVKN